MATTMNRSPPRRSSNYGTSSAFSANANANEDWTQISDLAERRRIQNRIAQRNYRKKLKRRLEDLEKRAASSSASPDEDEPELPKPRARGRARTKSSTNSSISTRTTTSTSTSTSTGKNVHSSSSSNSHYPYYNSPPLESSSYPDERGAMFAQQCTRQLSASPPPVFSYASYSHLHPYGPQAYSQSPPLYHSPSFQSTTPTPSFHDLSSFFGSDYSSGHVKRVYADEEIQSPFSISYANMAGIDLGYHQQQHQHRHQPMAGSNLPMLPPAALLQDQKGDCSTSTPSTPAEISLARPLTPESDPCSPRSFPLF